MRIRFLSFSPPYQKGEIAVKDDSTARDLIERGVAVPYVDPAIEELAAARAEPEPKPAPKPQKRRARKAAAKKPEKASEEVADEQ